jgi:hypothetical protein
LKPGVERCMNCSRALLNHPPISQHNKSSHAAVGAACGHQAQKHCC